MTTTPHTDCPHPATKAARAKCRKERAKAPQVKVEATITLDEVIAGYFDNSLDIDEVLGHIAILDPEAYAQGKDLDIEELIALVNGNTPRKAIHTMIPSPPLVHATPRLRRRAASMMREVKAPITTFSTDRDPDIAAAYARYIDDGISATDGYYAPISYEAFASTLYTP